MIEYNVIKVKRKGIAVCVTRDAKVEVRVPLKSPEKITQRVIEEFIEKNEQKIIKIRDKIKKNIDLKSNFIVDYGSKVLLRGKEYTVVSNDENMEGFFKGALNTPKNLTPNEIKRVIIKLYKNQAITVINEKVLHYSMVMGINPNSVKINSATTRWGSCSGKNALNFSWFLILADDSVIDYVVVHELAHIIQHNHSNEFWQEVEKVIPDYKSKKGELKQLEKILLCQNWSEQNMGE